jgi:hypothetical protein
MQTGPAVSIRGNVIRGLEEAGEVSKERKTPEEMKEENKTKKPFDYKKFYKADGGLMNMSFEEWLKGKQKYDMEELYNDYLEDLKQKKLEKKYPRDEAADGGRIGYQVGGVATPEQYAAALQKIGAGTEAQKRTSLGNYLGDYIATQGQKLGNAAVIPYQAAKGVLGIQGTPMTQSMQTSLQDIIQNQIKNTGKLSGDINYKDYGVQTSTGNEFLGFGNRSITDPEAALATTLGRASYTVDPQTGKVNFTGGTAYDFEDDQFGGLGKFISKGGVFGKEATQYNPDISIGKDFMKQFNQPKYPDYKTTALQSQYYKNNPSNLDFDLFRAAYAKASSTPDSQIKTDITDEGQIVTHFGNWDPSRTYAAYMSNTGTSNSNPFFDQFKGSQYSNMPTVMEAMYGAPGNINPYYANGGSVGVGSMFREKR